jgi:indole-3-glycerol phosphate synthase
MSVLDSIITGVLEEQSLRQLSNSELEERIASIGEVRKPLDSLRQNKFSMIAEVKRSSPSKGALAEIHDPASLAVSYHQGGASVVSVLTENRRFGGSLGDFTSVREKISLPMLRKDFIVNEYLVRESRAFGADLMLLIVAALPGSALKDLHDLGIELGMQVLVEVHELSELERALEIDPAIVGVNARNLKTLEIDINNFSSLLPRIPADIYRIAESGIASVEDARLARESGADAILVGETLVKSGNPTATISEFLSVANR